MAASSREGLKASLTEGVEKLCIYDQTSFLLLVLFSFLLRDWIV